MNKKNLDKQIGGSHYQAMPIQPIEYIQANRMQFAEGSAIQKANKLKAESYSLHLKVSECREQLMSDR
jgi:hypothetical protein